MAPNAWLDDLSEDWIPQPRSSSSFSSSSSAPSSSLPNSVTHNASDLQTQNRSRIPRLRTSSGSLINQRTPAASNRNPVTVQRRRSALAERSLSEDNIQSEPLSALSDAKSSRSRQASRSYLTNSIASVVSYGTVDQRPVGEDPGRSGKLQDTPEWRRRLLRGEMGYAEQKDLFSPMGIEKIFSPSKSPPKPSPMAKRQLEFQNSSAIPSSPPPWPSRPNRSERSAAARLAQWIEDSENEQSNDILEGEPNTADNEDEHSNSASQHYETQRTEPSSISKATHVRRNMVSSVSDSGVSRTASGEMEQRNEEFSPVYLSRRNAVDDRLHDKSSLQLIDRLHQLRLEQLDSDVNQNDTARYQDSMEGSSLAKIQNMTLPEDLPVGTPDVARDLGKFVTTKRGGYSADGSSARRPLSSTPPLSNSISRVEACPRLSTTHPHSPQPSSDRTSVQDSVPPSAPTPPPILSTPRRVQLRRDDTAASPGRGSGSPLKLFGNHDTFTANKLHRRLSQLELGADSQALEAMSTGSPAKPSIHSCLTSVEEVSFACADTADDYFARKRGNDTASRMSSFGTGALDGYGFLEDISVMSASDSNRPDGGDSASPCATVAPPGSQPQFRFRLDESFAQEVNTHGKCTLSRSALPSSKNVTPSINQMMQLRSPKLRSIPLEHVDCSSGNKQTDRNAEGKRPPTSPAKNPTPKRRRTLHNTEISESQEAVMESVLEKSAAIQSVIGKRKDARRGLQNDVAEPNILAKRHILRPRNPTPSQRRRDEVQAEVLEATEAFLQRSPTQLQAIREDIDASEMQGSNSDRFTAAAVANEVATFTLNVQAAKDDSRKRSVTTQDFLDEAMKIMEFIRTKGRPTSGLGSLEESESEHAGEDEAESKAPGSPLEISSPASRSGPEGRWRNPQAHVYDLQTLSHLRKFKEGSSDFIPTLIPSLHKPRKQGTDTLVEHYFEEIQQGNIRIREPLQSQDPHDPVMATQKSQSSQNTMPSYDSSAGGRSVATNASKRSETVATLAPQAVAHLIPEEIAGMTYDKERGAWVKKKAYATERPSEVSIESEEDPFRNIPDLTVDEIKEIQNISGNRPNDMRFLSGISGRDFIHSSTEDASQGGKSHLRQASNAKFSESSSTVNSKPVHFSSSTEPVETRATSWSEQEMINQARKQVEALPIGTKHTVHTDEVEHEIRIDEGRNDSPERVNGQKLRDVTITFSSPAMPRLPTSAFYTLPASQDNYVAELPATRKNHHGMPQRYHQASAPKVTRSSFKPGRGSYGAYPAEDEYSEMSFVADRSDPRRALFSLNVSGSVARRQHVLVPPPISPNRADVTFFLSDLPDFSVNQIDERELPDRMVMQRNGKAAIEDRFAQGTAELVKALQDVEPAEPFWETLRTVNLAGKGLPNLHRLDAFCWSLEEIDVSDNTINHLNGVPSTVRRFDIRNNCLSGLSSWGHLMNLQHLDVSGNDIDNLKGFSSLVHLRELIIDDNRIESLAGIQNLDGLIKLSVRRNNITSVEFRSSNLKCLTELDLSANQIDRVFGLDSLPRLRLLNIDDNRLESLTVHADDVRPCAALKSLSVCRNQLKAFVVDSSFPQLKYLYADGNRLSHVEGVDQLRNLQYLSVRSQQLPTPCSSGTSPTPSLQLFPHPPNLSSLSLSANIFPTLDLPGQFLLLQRLELSSCGLNTLPPTFFHTVPNVRYLNLNTNGLKDLSPLLNTKALSELHVAGNRLSRLRKTMAVLARLSHLTKLDLRNNPITVGFHPPLIEMRLVSTKAVNLDQPVESEPFALPDADPDLEASHRVRLDEDTRLRRRVYEMLLGNSCTKLGRLDGLQFDARAALAKDEIFERLKLLGVLKKSEKDDDESSD